LAADPPGPGPFSLAIAKYGRLPTKVSTAGQAHYAIFPPPGLGNKGVCPLPPDYSAGKKA
jgi:hypothetical protein